MNDRSLNLPMSLTSAARTLELSAVVAVEELDFEEPPHPAATRTAAAASPARIASRLTTGLYQTTSGPAGPLVEIDQVRRYESLTGTFSLRR